MDGLSEYDANFLNFFGKAYYNKQIQRMGRGLSPILPP